MNRDLDITSFKIVGLCGFDMTHLLEEKWESHFNSIRGGKTWLDRLKSITENPERFGFKFPGYAESSYARTDRDVRNTFSKYYVKNFMPLFFELVEKKAVYTGLFEITIDRVSVSDSGAVTLRIESAVKNGVELKSTRSIIDGYYEYKQKVIAEIKTCVCKFIELLKDSFNKMNNNISFNETLTDDFEQYVSYYELVDFDYGRSGAKKMPIKSMYEKGAEDLLRPLVALFRMTKINFNSYDIAMISDIKNRDYGNRVDEIWAINEDRLLRHFPYEKADTYTKLFFLDVVLGIEILLQQKIVLQYLNQWIDIRRSKLREGINFRGERPKFDENQINPLIGEVVDVYDVISNGLIIQRNANHTFFNVIIEKSIDCMRLKEMLGSNRELIMDFFSLLSAISSRMTADAAVSVGEAGYKAAVSMGLLTRIMTAVAVLQLLVAVVMLLK